MKRKVLFFINGPVPTEADRALAAKLNTSMFRNALQVLPGENPERCTHAVGAVPANYFKDGKPIEGVEILPQPSSPAPVIETTENRPDTPAGGTQEPGGDLPPTEEASVVNESSTNAQIRAALDAAGVTVPRGVSRKADLLALLPQ